MPSIKKIKISTLSEWIIYMFITLPPKASENKVWLETSMFFIWCFSILECPSWNSKHLSDCSFPFISQNMQWVGRYHSYFIITEREALKREVFLLIVPYQLMDLFYQILGGLGSCFFSLYKCYSRYSTARRQFPMCLSYFCMSWDQRHGLPFALACLFKEVCRADSLWRQR